MTWHFTPLEVVAGALGGLLWSKLVLVRAHSMKPGSTLRSVLLLGGTFALIALVVWLALADAGDALFSTASRKIPDLGIGGAVYIALNVAVMDQLITAIAKAVTKSRERG